MVNIFNNEGYWNYGKYGYKAEFRELKESDIVSFLSTKEDWQIKKAKKFIGSKVIIVKFDYNKVFKKVKEELSK
jgi:hypothetical protein